MLPTSLFPSYKQYKTDSDAVATWLANTAQKCGYPKDLLTDQTTSQQKPPKLKGRARTKAREAARKKASEAKGNDLKCEPTSEGPKYLIAVNDFISLAEWISRSTKPRVEVPATFITVLDRAIVVRKRHHNWFNQSEVNNEEEDQANDSHGYFIGVLDKVREILQPRMPTEPLKDPSTVPGGVGLARDDSTTGQIVNLFANLDIEEPSNAFLDSGSALSDQQQSGSPKVRYGVNQASDLEEVYFAVHCLFNDFDNIRRYLQQVWNGYKQGAFDLVAASITTNTAIDFARFLQEDFVETFPNHSNFETHIQVLYIQICDANGQDPEFKERSGDEMNFAVYKDAETMLFTTYMLLSSFRDVAKPGILPVYKPGHFGVYDPSSDRASKSARDKFREDKVVLLEILPDFCVFAQMPGGIPAEDEMTRGIRQMVKQNEFPIWLTFAAQVFLDVHHVLRSDVSIGYQTLVGSASYVESNICQVLKFHENLRIQNWPKSNDQGLYQILEQISNWVKTDAVQDARTKLTRRSGFQAPHTEPFLLLKHHPLYCGLLSYSIKISVQEASIVFVNAWGSVLYSAHLYNALRQEKLLSNAWQDMDLALLMHRTQDMFVGDFPKTTEDFVKRLDLAMGYSATRFASNRRKLGAKASRAGPRQLNEDISPVSEMFKSRYCSNEGRTSLSPDDIDLILKKYADSDDNDGDDELDSEWATARIEIQVPDSPSKASSNIGTRSRKPANHKKGAQKSAKTGVRPIQLLNALLNAIQSETIMLTFNHFRLHIFSWQLLRFIKEAIGDNLRDVYGSAYIERENQLPFIVGYILTSAAQTKRLGGMLASEKEIVTSRFLVRTAVVMKEMLDAGLGAIEVRMLENLMEMGIEVPDLLELSG